MDVVVLQFALRNQGSLRRAELCAFWDVSLGEHPPQEAIHVEDQRQTGTGLGHHRPAGDGVQRAVFQTHGDVGVVTLLAP